MGNLSSKTLMIYYKTDVCHVTSAVMTYDLKFTLQHTTAANVDVTNVIASFYRDSDTVFHGVSSLYVPILYLSTFFLSNAGDFHLVMTGISGNVPATFQDFRRLHYYIQTRQKDLLSHYNLILKKL